MSSALAMILTTAMTVPGNGPEMVSGEMEQRLDLRGEWEGSLDSGAALIYKANLRENRLVGRRGIGSIQFPRFLVEEDGKGTIRATLGSGRVVKGIYRWEGDRVLICFRWSDSLRPTSFRADNLQWLLILHRVKPRK
jgi:hypothetical protein